MSNTSRIGEALGRFETALNTLETTMTRCQRNETELGKLERETQALRQDHTRLVQELNDVRGKASELAKANHDAAERVESAMARIRGVLGG
jgi:predicted  nucleic acid-binding Zn-ribbon protein